MNLENWGHFRPVAVEALHIQPPATFLYHPQLHQGNPQILATPAHEHRSASNLGHYGQDPFCLGCPTCTSSEPTSPTHTASSSGWFIPPAPDKGHPSLLWVLRNFPALEGRACLASSPKNRLLNQLHWQNCNCSFGVLPISANGLS